jgi:hypothetical protein
LRNVFDSKKVAIGILVGILSKVKSVKHTLELAVKNN